MILYTGLRVNPLNYAVLDYGEEVSSYVIQRIFFYLVAEKVRIQGIFY